MDAVRAYAIEASGDLLNEGGHSELWTGKDWHMIGADAAGRELVVLSFSARQIAA